MSIDFDPPQLEIDRFQLTSRRCQLESSPRQLTSRQFRVSLAVSNCGDSARLASPRSQFTSPGCRLTSPSRRLTSSRGQLLLPAPVHITAKSIDIASIPIRQDVISLEIHVIAARTGHMIGLQGVTLANDPWADRFGQPRPSLNRREPSFVCRPGSRATLGARTEPSSRVPPRCACSRRANHRQTDTLEALCCCS